MCQLAALYVYCVTQTTQIKQIFTDNFVHHEFLICGHLFNLCHLCAIKNNPFEL